MKWLGRGRRSPPAASAHAAALERYDSTRNFRAKTRTRDLRLVIVDVETTGLRPYHDRLLALGAVAMTEELIRLDDTFEVTVRQDAPSAPENILVHGIDGTAQTSGPHAADALAAFLDFAQDAPLIAFHAEFDRVFVTRALREALGVTPHNVWLDLAELAPAVFSEHAAKAQTLDDWTALFGIENAARHEALADAVATAQLLQVVLARASQLGLTRFADLTARAKDQRWLARSLKTR